MYVRGPQSSATLRGRELDPKTRERRDYTASREAHRQSSEGKFPPAPRAQGGWPNSGYSQRDRSSQYRRRRRGSDAHTPEQNILAGIKVNQARFAPILP